MESKALQRYLARVKRRLLCPRADRARLCETARTMLAGFAEENPGAGYEDFVSNFGTPQDFAETMLSGLDRNVVRAAELRRKRLCQGLTATLILVLVLTAAFWCDQYFRSRELTQNGDVTVIIGTPEKITGKEAEDLIEQAPPGAQFHAEKGD